MGKKPQSSKEIDRLQTQGRARASEIISDDARFKRFPDSPLATKDPRFSQTSTFLGGAPNPYAQSLAYQALPGMTYANRPGTTEAFYPQANIAPPAATTPPASGGISDLYKSAPAIEGPAFRGREISAENQKMMDELLFAQNERDFDEALRIEDFIKSRDMLNDGIFKIQDFEDYIGGDNVRMTMADGGIASLPVEMSGGGMPGGMDLYGGAPTAEPTGMQKFGSMMTGLSGKLKDFSSELAGGSSSQAPSDLQGMSKEQLIALIMQSKGGMKSNPSAGRDPSASSSSGPDIAQIAKLAAMAGGMQNGGLATLAQGGDVDFPRMNGPISGPGTETSDDIPAMLSDGEFVVNAKAVRGVGKLNGADGSKEEQRRNGARMMYALQKAGEQAMRKA